MTIGAFSYAAGAVGFFVLFLLLMTSWRGRLQGALLLVTVFITFLWSLASIHYAISGFQQGVLLYHFFEVLRSLLWLIFLIQLLKPLMGHGDRSTSITWFLYPGLFLFSGILLLVDLFSKYFLNVALSIDLSMLGHVSLAIAGLALIEQLFRNTRPQRRWATKFLYLGVGTLFVYDFFFYSNALLFRSVDYQLWSARGFIYAMVVPFIAVSATRNPDWSLEVFVSRRMVIHSASVVGAGLYLLLMAGVGYYIRIYGGNWGTALQAVFLVGAVVLLLILLFSGQLRAAIKVFFNKHFFHYKYDYREEWLKFIDTLSNSKSGNPLREQAIRALAEIVHSTGGMLWMRGANDNFSLAVSWNMGEVRNRNEPGDSSLIDFLERRQWIIELDSCEAEPELYEGLVLPGWLQEIQRAWLCVPLLQSSHLLGFMVLAKPRVKQRLNWEDRDLLKTAGRQVASYVALLDTTDALMEARQFEAFNRLSAYVVHDLKNITAQLSLLVTNAARHKSNPAFVEDAIRTVENATVKMQRMVSQLRKGAPNAGESSFFKVGEVLREVVIARSIDRPRPVLTAVDASLCLQANCDRFMAVLGHLIQNAQEATSADGKVKVTAYQDAQKVVIEVTDNGCGMDELFIREHLFRPFSTTKGNAGMGIGVYEAREFAHALGGDIDVVSKPALGTTFFLRLPLVEKSSTSQDNRREMEVSLARIDQETTNRRG